MSSLSKSFRLSSTLKIEEEAMVINKNQGIGSILGSDISDERSTKSSSSLRRTLSADMSSTKWLTQQGFSSPMKKIASSEEFSICSITNSSSSDDEEDAETEPRSQNDIWSSIQEEEYKKKQQLDEKSGQFDIWSSLIQQKSQEITDNKPLPPPYIHPLGKRSSSLSEKSLEICTESLGSETGWDGISSYPASESGDVIEDDKETEPEQQQERVKQTFENFEEVFMPKYNYVAAAKKSPQRSFPPPIPSLRHGACIRMRSRRDNGRLVLEAVSVPSTNNFVAKRQDGRLVLTFANSISSTGILRIEQEEEKKEVEELEEEFESFDDEDKESDESEEEVEEEEEGESEVRGVDEGAFVMEGAPKLSGRLINAHRLTLMGLPNRDPTWPNKLNEVVKFDEVEEDIKPAIVAKSLPPMARFIRKPQVAAAAGTVTAAAAGAGGASFNAYEYYWRPKPITTTQSKGKILSKNSNYVENNQEQQQLLVLRENKGDYLVPLLKSCKEPRRSLLFWEPYCIATS